MSISFYNRTYKELKDDVELGFDDPYKIMSSLNPKMREAVLNNPSGYDEDEVCQILALDGNVVIGTVNPFSGRLLLDGEIVKCQNGSNLFAHEHYRKDSVGGDLFIRLTNLKTPQNGYFAGISQMAIGMYRVLKYTIFEFPRLIYLRKSRSVIQSVLHSESWWTRPFIWGVDMGLKSHRLFVSIHNALCYRDYMVEEKRECPDEVEKIVKQDSHCFMELHDKAWFDWGLHYSFSEDKRTLRRLYVVKKDNKIEAFFFIKQEFFSKASSRGFKNVYLGTIMELGISHNSLLKENDIILMSLQFFDNKVDGIQFASSDPHVVNRLKRWLFIGVGHANIGVRIRTIKDERLKDINNWRIRLGGNDTVLN